MRRRLSILATLLLLVLAVVPQPAAAVERATAKPVKAASGALAVFWEGLRHLPLLSSLRKLGPEMDPGGTPKPSNSPGGSSIPQSDLGPEMDPWG